MIGGLEQRCPGWKKIEKINNRGGTIIRGLRVNKTVRLFTLPRIPYLEHR